MVITMRGDMMIIFFLASSSKGIINGMVLPEPVPAITTESKHLGNIYLPIVRIAPEAFSENPLQV